MGIGNLDQFSVSFQNLIDKKLDWEEFLTEGRIMVGELVSSQGWLNNTLARLVLDEAFLQSQYQSADPNDIILYRSPARSFSVRAFIWEPGITYPVHDHGAWGLVGAHFNQVREWKYRRLDDGTREGYAQLEVASEGILEAGQTTYVRPLNDGIHRMAAANDLLAITIHVYGSPIRKGFFQTFDLHNHSLTRVYPPQIHKKALAIRALGCMPETWAEDVLQEVVNRSAPEYIALEGQKALENIARLKD